jgi:hypothetical protein
LIVLALSGGCLAQIFSESDTLSILPVSGSPGDTISISISLTNTFAIGGFQGRIIFDSLAFAPLDMHIGPRCQTFTLMGANFEDAGVASFYATSWNPIDNAIPPGRGVIAFLHFYIRPGTSPGNYAITYRDSDSLSHENSLSNSRGDSLVIPILASNSVEILPGSAVADDGTLPRESGLAQNYPNPFNGATRISFTLENSENVNLTVYDMLGRTVVVIYSGWGHSGENTVYWDSQSADVTSGLYFYRLNGSQCGMLTKMMTLLK